MSNLPSSGSKNPVIGVLRCPYCNEAATVHEANRRGRHRYTICPDCGTDQKTGKPFQSYIAANMVDSLDDLPQTAPPLGLQTEAKPTNPTESEPKQTESEPKKSTELEPKQTESEPKNTPVMLAVVTVALLLLGGLVALFKPKKQGTADAN